MYFQFGGDFDPISHEEVDYDPDTMFRFRVGDLYYVLTDDDIRGMSQAGRTVRNPITNQPFTEEESRNLMDFVRRNLPEELLRFRPLVSPPAQSLVADYISTYEIASDE